ncbi:hypothetical protein GCM10027046_29310 [Uliginosibacterium flavum]|uniref:Toxin-antitoxin system toxin component, PIN family n=1 Tax=Uliginosibacterium flavum TaxID=1396831 RepID=A0ABV2TGJ7_9RHOO
MPDLLPCYDSSRPLRLLLDTNVVMALWHFVDPKLSELAAFIAEERALLFTRADCLDELQRVLAYHQFAIAPERQLAIHATYAGLAQCLPEPDAAQIEFAATLPRCKDRDDQKFVTAAWDAAVEVLVTRDKLLLALARKQPLRGRIAILTPERLLLALKASGEAALKSAASAP